MVFSEILPQNHLNSDADLSVQRKPIVGSSLFGITSFDTIRRNWDSLCSLETFLDRGNFICYYFWMFLIFIGCFPTKMYNCSVTSHILRAVFFHGLKVRTTADGKVQHALLLDPCVFHTSKYILAVERQSVCFCFMIRQCCKMETKVNLESPTFLFPKVQPA